jgi:protein TonB
MFAVQNEPERRHRGRVFAGAAALALLVQGGALLLADRLEPARPTPPRPPVSFTLVTPPPAPPPPPPSVAPPPPASAPAAPERTVQTKPRPATHKPAPAPVTGLNTASTVTDGAGPVFATGDTVMGTPEAVAAAPTTAPPEPPAPAAPIVAAKPAAPTGPRAPARLLQKVAPPYPEAARSEGLEGEVVLMLTIDTRGHVTAVRLVKGLAPPLDAAAVEAARATLWDPARVGDTPVITTQRFNVRFMLEG